CPSVPSPRTCQTALAAKGAECQVLSSAARRWLAKSLWELPFARVRTAVDVQHLPGDVTSFSQINDGLSDVLRVGDRAHRGEGLHEVPRGVLVKRGIDNARRDRIEADIVLCIFTRQAEGDGIKSALGDHRNRCRKVCDGVLEQ